MIKFLFCLLLLTIFHGITPSLGARVVLQPATTADAVPLHTAPEVRPANQHSIPGISYGIQLPGSDPTYERLSTRKGIAAILPSAATGKRFSFKERLMIKYLRKQFNKLGMREGEPADPRKLRLGRLALILGAGAFVVAFIPFLQILSPLMAITAVALGIVSVQGNSNLPGILGICFGGAFVLLILAVVAIFVLTFSSW
jgi:hypothetical protein